MRTVVELRRILLTAGVCALAASPAYAVDRATSDALTATTDKLESLNADVADIRKNFADRGRLMGSLDAEDRFREAVYLYMLGEYEKAAREFYILHRANALRDEGSAKDAEWYLGECLFEMRNYPTAIRTYASIVARHETTGARPEPYFQDAVRRLLEVYAFTGDGPAFDAAYLKYIVPDVIQPTEQVTYTLAKSFHRRGERVRAKAEFEKLPATSPWWSRGRYFLGAMMVQEQNFVAAIDEFKRVEAFAPTDDDQAKVQEYARLALARVYYETGDFAQASQWYGTIGDKSTHFAQKSYESVWAYVKQERWEDALAQIDTFLLAFPENRHSAGLRLLHGRINLKIGRYDSAKSSYDKVVELYGPTIGQLASAKGTPEELRTLLEGVGGLLSVRLPPYALETLRARDDVSRAAEVHKNLISQEGDLKLSEVVIKEIAPSIDNEHVLGAFTKARVELDGIMSVGVSIRADLIETETTYLRPKVSSAQRAELDAIRKERTAIVSLLASAVDEGRLGTSDRERAYDAQVRQVQQEAFRVGQVVQEQKARARDVGAQLASAKLSEADRSIVVAGLEREVARLDRLAQEIGGVQNDGVRQRIVRLAVADRVSESNVRDTLVPRFLELRTQLKKWRGYATESDAAGVFAQIDRVWTELERIDSEVAETRAKLNRDEAAETARARDEFRSVTAQVAALRARMDRDAGQVRATTLTAIRIGIDDLEQSFRDTVMDAESGVLDVDWERTSRTADRKQDLEDSKTALKKVLESRYALIEQTLGPPNANERAASEKQ
jgi:tetratricopeptide (TPR) repeat protein